MTEALFDVVLTPGRHGPLRQMLDERIGQLTDQGIDLPGDLVLVVQSLADRIDTANAVRAYRGFVILTAEYRAARRDLFDGVNDTADDGLETALAAFRAATADDAARPEPPY